MPPVELNPIPTSFHETFTNLKMTQKAMDIPVVNDTFAELDKVKIIISEDARIQAMNRVVGVGMTIVEEGIKKLKDTEKANLLLENERICVCMSSMKDTVLPRMTGSLEKLDHLACDGLDSLTTALPALTSSTPDLYVSTKEAARSYLCWATEYVASFTVSQITLSMADTSLAMAETVTRSAFTGILGLRRSLKDVRLAGLGYLTESDRDLVVESDRDLLVEDRDHLVKSYLSREEIREILKELRRAEESSEEEAETTIEDDAELSEKEDELSEDGVDLSREEEEEFEEEILRAQRAEESFEIARDEAEIARVESDLTNEVVYETCGLGGQCCNDGICEVGLEL